MLALNPGTLMEALDMPARSHWWFRALLLAVLLPAGLARVLPGRAMDTLLAAVLKPKS